MNLNTRGRRHLKEKRHAWSQNQATRSHKWCRIWALSTMCATSGDLAAGRGACAHPTLPPSQASATSAAATRICPSEAGAGFLTTCGSVFRGNRNELPGAPGAGPALSDPCDVQGSRHIVTGVLWVARPAGERPSGGQSGAAHQTEPAAPRESSDLWESQDVAKALRARRNRGVISCSTVHAEQWAGHQVLHEAAYDHAVQHALTCGRQSTEPAVCGRSSQSREGGGPPLYLDHRRLTPAGPSAGALPASRCALLHREPAHGGANPAGPPDGVTETTPKLKYSSPFGSQLSVCSPSLPIDTYGRGKGCQHVAKKRVLGQRLRRELLHYLEEDGCRATGCPRHRGKIRSMRRNVREKFSISNLMVNMPCAPEGPSLEQGRSLSANCAS
jgi:hypothetical protein